ncbi:MAG: FtsX-like permease family protein, partial [Candidatus Hodarchaeales archaeon]|jgi:putative ABC transport system permease protein
MLTDKYLSSSWGWDYFRGYNLITFPTFLKQILVELSKFPIDIRWGGQIHGKICLDSTNFNAFNINVEKSKLQKFIISLEDNLYTLSYDIWVWSDVLNRIQQFEMTIIGLIIIMLLVSFPVICIALYLVTYSFGLIRRQKQEQIGIIKTRGGSWLQVLTVLLGEMVISTVLAVFAGFILSIILSDVVLRSTNYLEFLGNPVPVRFSTRMIQDLIIWGIIIALLLNFLRIIRMSRQNITDTLIPVETRGPLWKRYYIDVIIFIVGTATWMILMTMIRMTSTGEDVGGFYVIYMLVSLLGIPAPFLMFFGTIMVIARIFPFLMNKLAEILWKIEGGINAFAIRNIVRHKQAANRAVLLITLAISFSILASSLIFSLDETEHLKHYYKHGADISLSGNGIYNETITKLLKENVTDITHVSSVFSAEYQIHGMIWREFNFLFLDPNTYGQTAFFKSSFKLSNSLSNLMEKISDNQTIILYEGNFKNDVSKPKLGDNLTIFFSNSITSKSLSFKIGGTFNLWPMVYPESWYSLDYHYWMIGSLGMFESLNHSNYLSRIENSYLAKLDSKTNIENTVEKVYNLTNITPISPALKYIQYKESFTRHFTLSILNTDLIICVTVSVIGVIMFAFFTYVERGKEIGVERALGMTRVQTAISFLVEASTILAFGTVIGFLTGTYFVTMFLQITQFGVQIPPIVVTYPIPLLIQILLAILVVAGIGTVAPAYMATRRDISRILKVE